MRNLFRLEGLTDETKEYIMSKCKQDANFVVRMVYAEMEGEKIKADYQSEELLWKNAIRSTQKSITKIYD